MSTLTTSVLTYTREDSRALMRRYALTILVSLVLHLLLMVLMISWMSLETLAEEPEQEIEVPLTFEPEPQPQLTPVPPPQQQPRQEQPNAEQVQEEENQPATDASLLGFRSEGEVEGRNLRPVGPQSDRLGMPQAGGGVDPDSNRGEIGQAVDSADRAPRSERPDEVQREVERADPADVDDSALLVPIKEPEPQQSQPPPEQRQDVESTPAQPEEELQTENPDAARTDEVEFVDTPSQPESRPDSDSSAPEGTEGEQDVPESVDSTTPSPPLSPSVPRTRTSDPVPRPLPQGPGRSRLDYGTEMRGGMFGDVSFDSPDYNWSEYSTKIYFAVYREWLRQLLSHSKRLEREQKTIPLTRLDSEVVIHFVLNRDGSVTDLEIVAPSAIPSLDSSSSLALTGAVMPPLPSDFPRDSEGITYRFILNVESALAMEKLLQAMRWRGDF